MEEKKLKSYERKFDKQDLKEGMTSLPELKKMFKSKYSGDLHSVIGSIIEVLKTTGLAKKVGSNTWNKLFQVYDGLEQMYEKMNQ